MKRLIFVMQTGKSQVEPVYYYNNYINNMKRLVLFCLLVCLWIPAFSPAQSPQKALNTIREKYKEKLDTLADWCASNNLPEQEKITRQWGQSFPKDRVCLYEITTDSTWTLVPSTASANEKKWAADFIKLRIEHGNQLISHARANAVKGRTTFAFDLLMLALRENPQQKQIRKMLGYVEYQKRWATMFDVRLMKSGLVNHEKFGWIPAAYVPRYEKGDRFYNNQWMSAQQESSLRQSSNDPWTIITPHYSIKSYPSLEEGVVLGRKLENLVLIWNQLFLRFFATDKQMHAFFAGQNANFPVIQHKVYFYRSRQQYISEVSRITKSSFAGQTLGVYYSESNTKTGTNGAAFFFAGSDYDERTMLHEATHQLFSESRHISFNPAPNINVPSTGKSANFWVIEGIATFMESLTDKPGRHELGNPSDDRIFAARYRCLKNNFYVPSAVFAKMSREQYQNHPQVGTLYSQAAGLTWFLIFYDEGKYRDCLVTYLSTVYSGMDNPQSLSQITGSSFEKLDKEYIEYLKSTIQPDDQGAHLPNM